MKLGKQPPRDDPRTLRLANYLSVKLPTPPTGFGVVPSASLAWGMLANDRVGDCTIAAAAHTDMAWRKATGRTPRRVNDSRVLKDYAAITGYNANDPSTDQGAVELDVLNYWRKHGVCGEKITAFAAVKPSALLEVKQACWLFGGLYLGVNLPVSAQDQNVWDFVGGPGSQAGSWGGHAINVIGYDHDGLTFITWGSPKRMTWAFWNVYVDECWAVLGPDYLKSATLKTPAGFDQAALLADVAAL